MFWRFGGYANISTIDTILDKPDVTVEELLEESDLIQELKQQNSKLIEYLRQEDVLERLLRYVVAPKPPPSQEGETGADTSGRSGGGTALDSLFGKARVRPRSKSIPTSETGDMEESKEEKQRLKYAYMACEILSSEVWSISEALMENQAALRKFWQYLKQPPSLDPVQAAYFTKVNESLLDRKTEEMLELFKSIDNIVPDMLQHVDCPMIMDLLLKIISLERSEGGQGIVEWLQSQDLIPLLLSYLSPEHSSASQTSAGDFLKAIITISANATTQDQNVIGPNELTRQLVSEECIQTLISDMLRGGNPLTVGVGIVIEVIRKNNSDYDLDNQIGPVPKSSDPIYLGTLLRQFAKHVPDFMELIQSPNHTVLNSDGTTTTRRRELKVAFGGKIEPLGFDRFKTCELMAELLHCSNMALLNERGSEAEVKRRDTERERLKTEGKLGPSKDAPSANDFGTSVDSSGFHHAIAPSDESPTEIKRHEISNSVEEDEFEKVAVPETLAEESKDDFDEKVDLVGEPLERSPRVLPQALELEKNEPMESLDESLPPHALQSNTATLAVNKASPPKPGRTDEQADSPTSAGLTDKVGGLDLDNDTVMTSSSPPSAGKGEPEPVAPTDSISNPFADENNQGISPHPDDKPAPLFSGKAVPQSNQESSTEKSEPTSVPSESEGSNEPTHTDEDSSRSAVLSGQEEAYDSHYEVDIDGSPVVGDLLKMMFVRHRVVPTILDFFFRFPWNNFLHNVVYDVVQQVFNGQMDRGFNRGLAIDLFETGRITDRIIEGQQASDKAQKETSMRLGYMGHLTLIAEEVVKFSERHPPELLAQSVLDKVMSQGWIDYVEHILAETRERDNAILGGVRPDMAVGPRQAVLNAVNAAQGFGNSNTSLASAGLTSNDATIGLDSMELTNTGSASGAYSFSGGGGNMLSGFNNSSDEEDEEMDEGDAERSSPHHVNDEDQPGSSSPVSVPSPLQIQPSRARRRLALRLKQRKRAEQNALDNDIIESGPADVDSGTSKRGNEEDPETIDLDLATLTLDDQAVEQRGPARFSILFGSDSSDESDNEEGTGVKIKSSG